MKLVYNLKFTNCKNVKDLVHISIDDNAEVPDGYTSDFRDCMEGFEKKAQDAVQENKEAEKEVGEKETACEDEPAPKKRGRPKKTEG